MIKAKVPVLSGRLLNRLWSVGAKHALYHRGGTWYNNLKKFPGALFDPHGYVMFLSEHEYLRSERIRVTKETNVFGGIAGLPGYVRISGMGPNT